MNATMTPPRAETITLYFREGSSDKVYQAAIEPKGELFVVNFAYGRRGSTLQTGVKTSSPVDYQTAKNHGWILNIVLFGTAYVIAVFCWAKFDATKPVAPEENR